MPANYGTNTILSQKIIFNDSGYYAQILKEKYNDFPHHKGRKGQVGGSLPKSEGTTDGQKKQLSPEEKAQKQADRQKRLLKAIKELKANEEVVVKDIRDDLKQYGVTNDIALKWGYHDKATGKGSGVYHILYKHGKKDFVGIVNAIVYGQIKEYVRHSKQLVIEHNGYKSILSLNENGKKKVWLLSGYKINPNYKNKKQVIKNAQGEISEF